MSSLKHHPWRWLILQTSMHLSDRPGSSGEPSVSKSGVHPSPLPQFAPSEGSGPSRTLRCPDLQTEYASPDLGCAHA